MAKTKNNSFDAEELEEQEELTAEEKREILAEDERRWACAVRAVEALTDLGRVPSAGRERFREEVLDLMHNTFNDLAVRDYGRPRRSKALVDLERSIRVARGAIKGLTKWERAYLEGRVRSQMTGWGARDVGWNDVLSAMIKPCATLTGKNPWSTRSGRGRPRGGIKDYPFSKFIRSLAWALHFSGGRLTLDVKGQRGSWVKALDALRPLLPTGFIPVAPPLSTIEKWIREDFDAGLPP
jgi:hypothetical protein